jgi:hypothetical protein
MRCRRSLPSGSRYVTRTRTDGRHPLGRLRASWALSTPPRTRNCLQGQPNVPRPAVLVCADHHRRYLSWCAAATHGLDRAVRLRRELSPASAETWVARLGRQRGSLGCHGSPARMPGAQAGVPGRGDDHFHGDHAIPACADGVYLAAGASVTLGPGWGCPLPRGQAKVRDPSWPPVATPRMSSSPWKGQTCQETAMALDLR